MEAGRPVLIEQPLFAPSHWPHARTNRGRSSFRKLMKKAIIALVVVAALAGVAFYSGWIGKKPTQSASTATDGQGGQGQGARGGQAGRGGGGFGGGGFPGGGGAGRGG